MMRKKHTVHRGKVKVERSAGKLTWYSFEEVFRKSNKNESFTRAYDEESMRLQLAAQIRAARTKKKLTQKAVAERSGMPQSVIARIESGERGLTIGTLGKVAYVLGKKIQLA